MAFPETLTNAVNGETEIDAGLLNAIETKLGIDDSNEPTSIDYLLKNPSSVDPGHLHSPDGISGGDDGDVIFKDPSDHAWKQGSPDEAGLVATTGDQTIYGVKTFDSLPRVPTTTPTEANQVVSKSYADLGQVPVGAILPYGGLVAPSNFLLCDGSEVLRSTYAALFSVISTRFGNGNGTTTFNLPDLRGRFLAGYKSGVADFDPIGEVNDFQSGTGMDFQVVNFIIRF